MSERVLAVTPEPSVPAGLPIAVDAVGHSYVGADGREVRALEEVNIWIQAGEFVAFLGPSGCGKSTLLLTIGGLLKPTDGVVRIDDEEIHRPYTQLGIVFQDPTLLDWRTALRNILVQAEVRGLDKTVARARALELMKTTKLSGFEDSYPSGLSGGMKQRVAICRALLHDPPLLLMDEPFAALDALTRDQMRIDLQSLWLTDRKTVIFVTHSITEAVFLADRVVVFSSRPGRVLKELVIDMPRPRKLEDQKKPAFLDHVETITDLLRQEGVLQE